MDDKEAFDRACALAHDHGKTAMEVVAHQIEASLNAGNAAEAKVWNSVGETLAQVDRIASCRFTLSGRATDL